ncbi:Capsule polysaccharide modification protein LipA [Nymphon striatum]|nr:Capsule polysaccharide modification protein LipA [Nymphon striatum]
MHLFEYALRDFINLEKKSASGSAIFIHDLYPMNAETSTRERNSDFWSGDVWKLVLCLSEYRPDLDLKVLPCPPTGLGFVKNLDSASSVLEDNYDIILGKYVGMSYDSISRDKDQKLKLLSFVILAYDMPRELPRTLDSLSDEFQQDISSSEYEIILIENESENLLDYQALEDKGIINASKMNDQFIVATHAYHLGDEPQNLSVPSGRYNQLIEDALLETIAESNCIALPRSSAILLGGFDEDFVTLGGGYVNLDFYKRAQNLEGHQLVYLLGEGTFHQVHGGVATNRDDTPHLAYKEEYIRLRGKPYEVSPLPENIMFFDSLLSLLGKKVTKENKPLSYSEWISKVEKNYFRETNKGVRADSPVVSIILPISSSNKYEQINSTINSILGQVSPQWELMIVTGYSLDQSHLLKDKRIRVISHNEESCFYTLANYSVEKAQGDMVLFLSEGDILSEYAVHYLRECALQNSSVRVIVSDEDLLDENGERKDPFFKPDWNPDYLLSFNYFSRAVVYEKDLFIESGGFDYTQQEPMHGLAITVTKKIKKNQIHHIDKVLFHFKKRIISRTYRLHYILPDPKPIVSIIIPTKDNLDLLSVCLKGLFNNTSYENFEIIVIDNQSQKAETIEYLNEQAANSKIRLIKYNDTFNYSEMNNLAVEKAKAAKEIGCIGAKLFYPDGTIQHAGVILGLKGYASHAHKGAVKDENGYFNRLVVTHNISAVTAACMVVRKSVFQKVGGFDAENLKVAYNDVDLCLKVIEAGYRNLFTPHAKLVHHESKSRGKKRNKAQQLALREESEYLVKKWGDVLKNDPAYNKNLTLLREDFSLAQLDSIVTQTYKNVEIHVFDDCSKDETTAIVKTYCDKYKNIFLYQNKVNVGFLKNFENAISSISGKYIALSDQDDIWSPSKLKLSMMAIKELEKQYPDKPALVHSDLSTIDSEGQLIQASFFKQKKINLPPQKSLMRILGHCGVMGNTILMNHLLVEKALPFPEGLKYHDYWLSLINELFGVRKTIGDSLVQYRIHNKNISNNNKLTNNRIRYLDLRNRDFPLPFKEDHREFAIKHLLDHYSLQFEEKTLISQFYDYLLFKGIRNLENLKIFLDIDEIQYKPEKSCSVEYVVGWGRKDNTKQARDYADINKLDYYALEDGFFHSMGQGVLGENSCSLVKDKKGIYYDATQSSDLEELINAKNKKLFSLENIGRAKHAIQRITKSNISKYNNGSLKLDDTLFQTNEVVLVIDQTAGDMSLKYGYVNKNTFGEMMQAALNENPDAQIIVKTHPDVVVGKKKGNIDLDKYQGKVKIISSLVNPFVLLRKVDVVYVATSQVGFEALMLGKRVVCFGVPFYSGWGLTEDRASKELEVWDRRKSNRTLEEVFTAAYIHYPIYMNPDLNSLCEIEDVLSFFERQFLNRTRVNGRLFCFNFTLWKRNYINAFIKPLGDDLVFVRSVDQAKKMNINSSDQIVCWASKENIGVDKLASKLNIDVWNVEDGFIRSAGLGTDLTAPASLVLDKTGIYYDPNQSCDLEKILQLKKFKRTELERSNALKTALIANELSKYNLGKAFTKDSLNLNPNQKIILIPGQVEDDASIKKGTVDVSTNQGLIESVRKNNNDAFLIYKPHPDVVSGNRKGKVIKAILEANVDLVLHDASITDCLAVADEVHTMTSLVGFEALMRELKVVCYGLPFYSNWGLTTDIHNLPRRTRKLSLNELVAGTLIDYPLYYDWQLNQLTTPEVVVQQLKEKIEKQGGKQSNQISPLVRIMRKSVNFLKGVTQMENFDLDIALQDADADYNAAEAQAIACGLLVVNIASDKIAWVKLIFGDVDADNSKQHKAIKLAGELFDDIKKQLQDSNMGFDLLLPEEDESLYARVTALQQWCSGFVLGMAMSGVKDNKNLPEDSRELLADITEIGTEGEFDLDDVEQSEEAYAEISEYVRMGILLINEELQPLKQSSLIH